jgi:hypothetical protein
MTIQYVLLPLFVQVILTFVMFLWMSYHRVTLIRSGTVKARDVSLRQPNWPPHVLQVANAAHNQLETPVLFYVITILAIITRHADVLFVVLAWIYVALRFVHVVVHVTTNEVRLRGPAFGFGLIVLIIMWISLIVRVLAGLP